MKTGEHVPLYVDSNPIYYYGLVKSGDQGNLILNNMNPTTYPELNTVLQELISNLENILADELPGAYLQGCYTLVVLTYPSQEPSKL
jgi:hypothetical protein